LSTVSVANSGSAAYTTSSLAAGTHTISATYIGDTNFVPSIGSLSLVVSSAVAPSPPSR
jgi:hypothetical protein